MFAWFGHQINTHPRATAGLVVARLCLWFSTFVWGIHALLQDHAFIHPIYKSLGINLVEKEVGSFAAIMAAIQIWRILTHESTHWIGFVTNTIAFCWYGYFMYAMFVFVPLAGPIFSAFTTLMFVISIVSMAHDFWMTHIFFNWLSCSRSTRLTKST